MRKYALTLAALCLAAAGMADLRSEVMAVNNKIIAAIKARDADAFAKIVKACTTKDFKYVEMGRTMGLNEMIMGMRQGMTQMKDLKRADVKIVSVKEMGSKGTAKLWHNMEGRMMGQDKKWHNMGFTGMSTHAFVKVGGEWKMSMMKWGKQKMTMDGKPFDPSKMGGG